MVEYAELKLKSEEVNQIIDQKISKIGQHLVPVCFDRNIKYLVLNLNPSENIKEEYSTKEYLYSIDESKFKIRKEEIKLIKGKIVFDFFAQPFNLIKEIDAEVSLFWEDRKTFARIRTSLLQSKKLEKFDEILNKINDSLQKMPGNFLLFAELLYYRGEKQKDIREIVEKKRKSVYVNIEFRRKIAELLKIQLSYYKPEYLIITNAFVSKFFQEELLDIQYVKNDPEVKTTVDYKRIRVFFSSMLWAGNIDRYSKKRLQAEIKTYTN